MQAALNIAILTALTAGLPACGFAPSMAPTDDTTGDDQPPPPGEDGCPVGKAGSACILDLYDQASAACDADVLATLRSELDKRVGLGPLWAGGRGLWRTDAVRAIAGTFDDWTTTSIVSAPVCASDLIVAVGPVPSGFHQYKLYDPATDAWTLDAANPAFAYDDFTGNPDGVNSVLNTSDSGRGHLIELGRACSTALGNCRDVTAYLPPGYDALATKDTTYPVLFMHDGQNVWDDHDCCFGHTGWEINVTLDAEIAAGRVAPLIVIAAASTTARNAEYGLDAAAEATFMAFQVDELQPTALAKVRWDGGKVGIAGSSLGGLVAMDLALGHPDTYSAAISLSGAFWPGMENGDALRDRLPAYGKQPLAIYIDHGGDIAQNTDGAADSVEVRDLLVDLGWHSEDSPSCTRSSTAVCYHAEPGATHDELAWKARAWRFLRFAYAP